MHEQYCNEKGHLKTFISERDAKNAGVFCFCVSSPNGWPWSQAFLAETVETGDKNRDDFHCMQMSLQLNLHCTSLLRIIL